MTTEYEVFEIQFTSIDGSAGWQILHDYDRPSPWHLAMLKAYIAKHEEPIVDTSEFC